MKNLPSQQTFFPSNQLFINVCLVTFTKFLSKKRELTEILRKNRGSMYIRFRAVHNSVEIAEIYSDTFLPKREITFFTKELI